MINSVQNKRWDNGPEVKRQGTFKDLEEKHGWARAGMGKTFRET
jgi:hypothetical protein